MSNPSLSNMVATLASVLKRKARWLESESATLARLLREYGQAIGLHQDEILAMQLAAYYKNLGALYVSDRLLSQDFGDHPATLSNLKAWHLLSSAIAEDAELHSVAIILNQYYKREIPKDPLAKVFQVCNCWVACLHEKGHRPPMTAKDAKLTLQQRASLEWSCPKTVETFLSAYGSIPAE